jgi:hypothetical protein
VPGFAYLAPQAADRSWYLASLLSSPEASTGGRAGMAALDSEGGPGPLAR